MRPGMPLRLKGHAFLRQRMIEGDLPCMQAERRIADGERLRLADLAIGQIGGVAEDGEAEVPEVDADLIGAAGDGHGFDQRGAIGIALEDAELGAGLQAGFIDAAAAEFSRLGADGRVADELVLRGMTLHAGEPVLAVEKWALNLWLRERPNRAETEEKRKTENAETF